jgi:hypothetical protein
MGEEQRNKEAPQDFRMRYRVIIDDIKYIKSRQWAVTYYLLLLFAAIISFHHLVNPVYPWQEKILTFIAILVAALGTFYLMEFQYRLSLYRERLVDIVINNNLSDDFILYEKNLNDDIDEYKSWWKLEFRYKD